MSEVITVIVDQPRTITNVTRQNVTTRVMTTAEVNTLVRQQLNTIEQQPIAVVDRVPQTTTIAVAGLQGPQGPQGLPGLGSNTVVMEQATASASWNLVHNLGQFPAVTTVDTAGTIVYGAVTYVSENEITITFSSAMAGVAYLN